MRSILDSDRTKAQACLYLHGESCGLLIVVIEQVGHEGGVVGEALAHAQRDGLTREGAVAACRLHVDGRASCQHGQHNPGQIHCPGARQKHGVKGMMSLEVCVSRQLEVPHRPEQGLNIAAVEKPSSIVVCCSELGDFFSTFPSLDVLA